MFVVIEAPAEEFTANSMTATSTGALPASAATATLSIAIESTVGLIGDVVNDWVANAPARAPSRRRESAGHLIVPTTSRTDVPGSAVITSSTELPASASNDSVWSGARAGPEGVGFEPGRRQPARHAYVDGSVTWMRTEAVSVAERSSVTVRTAL